MLVPLYGFLEGDTLGLVLLAHDTWTMQEVADRLLRSASVRVRIDGAVEVRVRGAKMDAHVTVASAGLRALDRVDVRRARS